ncbi:MAG TPA: hypothetical protein VFZ21_26800 [Gemmatimonadaceae bacterium]|nr:hypothetical protein [Gemmatimonadaceae bacterium]
MDRRIGVHRATLAAVMCVGFGIAGCTAGDDDDPRADSIAAAVPPASTLRVATLSDSAVAEALADSLAREGWESSVGALRTGGETWPVFVSVPGDGALSGLVGFALRREGLTGDVLPSRPSRRTLAVRVTRVNGGTHGMSAHIRWVLSPDRRSLLVVEDPSAVENEPLPNGFAMATEGAPLIQRDSVWDVAPSPDWRHVAYARAYTTAAGEADTLPPSEWHRLAGRVGLLESLVRKNAFPTSGMVVAYGAARPYVVDATSPAAGDTASDVALPIAEGWRLAWTAGGARLAIGAPPELISDDGIASRWRLVDPATGASRGEGRLDALVTLQWTEGPILDVSTPIDMQQRRAFRLVNGDVESEDGWIRVFARDDTRLRAPRIVGPGVALTTTATGEFIVAIAPDPNAKSYEPPNHLVVYQIVRP